jgi:pilus assembly protein Flp/PilA
MIQQLFGVRLALMLSSLSAPSLKREEGQTLAEYALILALIAVVVIIVVATLGDTIKGIFSTVSSSI